MLIKILGTETILKVLQEVVYDYKISDDLPRIKLIDTKTNDEIIIPGEFFLSDGFKFEIIK